jgi:copper chaperone
MDLTALPAQGTIRESMHKYKDNRMLTIFRPFLAIAFSAMLLAGCNKPADSEAQPAAGVPAASEVAVVPSSSAADGSALTLATFKVEGMTCDECSAAISQRLTTLDGVKQVEADWKTGAVKVSYEAGKQDSAKLAASIEALQFKVAGATEAQADGCCHGDPAKAAAKTAEGKECCGHCKEGGECGKEHAKDEAGHDKARDEDKPKDDGSTQAGFWQRLLAAVATPAYAGEPEAEEQPKAEAPKAEQPQTEEKAKPKLPKLPPVAKGCVRSTFAVEYCCAHGCPPRTEEAVLGLKGVAYVKADYATATCTVDYREKEVTTAQIKDAILELGYVVDGQQPQTPHMD